MSWWVYLMDGNEIAELPDAWDLQGGTYALGGTDTAELNVTYNYSRFFYRVLGEGGLRGLHGKPARETLPLIEQGIKRLKGDASEDYWEATEGNARKALEQMKAMSLALPECVWEIG